MSERDFVLWWDAQPRDVGGRGKTSNSPVSGLLADFGLNEMQVSRWRSRLTENGDREFGQWCCENFSGHDPRSLLNYRRRFEVFGQRRIGELSQQLEKAELAGRGTVSLPSSGKTKAATLKEAGISTSQAEAA